MAVWSDIWNREGTRQGKERAIKILRSIPSSVVTSKKKGGKFPHLQPFFKNKKES